MTVAVWIVAAFLFFTVSAHLVSIALALFRLRRRGAGYAGPFPPVTILRPVCGLENEIEATLRSTFTLDWPDYEIVFCCASATDPVVPLVERLIAEHPNVPARLLTGDDRISINPKLNNLVKGWSAARHDWVLMADSNLLLPPGYIRTLFARWTPDTGLVCSPPIGGRPEGLAAEIECAFLNTYQARWQLAADTVGLGFAQGKTMLWRRDILDRAGGIRALAAEPAEDAAATKVVRGAGLHVRLVPGPFVQPLGRRAFGGVWSRQLRWARLRRVTFKVFFAPELFTGVLLPMLAAGFLAAAGTLPLVAPLALALLWYGAEAGLARAAGWHLGRATPAAWLIRDLLIPPLWLAAWAGSGFVWRGNAMHVGSEARPQLIARLLDRAAHLLDDDEEEAAAPRSAFAAALARRWRGRKGRSGA
jgi:ceramide glucosyltransferase